MVSTIGSWTLSSQDSVQQWIDSLTEAELRNALDEESETTPRATPTQKFSEVYFLPLPGSLGKNCYFIHV